MKPILFALLLTLVGCCPFAVAPYEAAQRKCLDKYATRGDIAADRDVACVDGVRTYEKELRDAE